MKKNKTKIIECGVMKPLAGGRLKWLATKEYICSKLWKLDQEALYDWLMERLPTLKGKPVTVYADDKEEKKLHVLFFNQDPNKVVDRIEKYGLFAFSKNNKQHY